MSRKILEQELLDGFAPGVVKAFEDVQLGCNRISIEQLTPNTIAALKGLNPDECIDLVRELLRHPSTILNRFMSLIILENQVLKQNYQPYLDRVADAEDSVAGLKGQLTSAMNTAASLARENAALKGELASAKDTASRMADENATLKGDLGTSASLADENAALKGELTSAVNTAASLANENDTLKDDIDRLRSERDKADTAKYLAKKAVKDIQEQLLDSEAVVEELRMAAAKDVSAPSAVACSSRWDDSGSRKEKERSGSGRERSGSDRKRSRSMSGRRVSRSDEVIARLDLRSTALDSAAVGMIDELSSAMFKKLLQSLENIAIKGSAIRNPSAFISTKITIMQKIAT